MGGDSAVPSIDQSYAALQQSPSSETQKLFTQQVGALQDMVTTADSVVQLQKDLASSFFLGGFRT